MIRRKSRAATNRARLMVRALPAWYAAHARELPWRRTVDPYAIWVSEVMLQQTQVATVEPYWRRWMRAFPNVRALARARLERVLKLWEGLGYYSRARNLHRGARIIMARFDGRFPDGFDQILSLPGVGRYTAGAISSIAFNQPAPVLDGNVMRVLCRVFGIGGNPRQGPANERLWRLAADLVADAGGAGACSVFNQALMELGATICLPRHPVCQLCPIRRECVAFREGRTETLPGRSRRAPSTRRRFVAVVLERRGQFCLRRRPAAGINASLWEFPSVELNGTGSAAEAARLLAQSPGAVEWLCRVRHSITRYRIELEVFRVRLGQSAAPIAGGRWVALPMLDRLPLTAAHRKVAELIKNFVLRPNRKLASCSP